MVRSKASAAKRKRLEAEGGAPLPPQQRQKSEDATEDPGTRNKSEGERTGNTPKDDDGLDPKRVYVSRLPKSWTDDVLAEKCAPFGAVARASVMQDAETGASRCFGFVVFEDETSKALVLAAKYLKGRLDEGGSGKTSRYACKVSDVNRGGDDTCRLWLEHRCPHGAACTFEHPEGRGGLLTAAAPAVKKCLEFHKRGKCSRGDACPFAHVAREKAPAPPREAAAGPKRCFTWAKKGKCRKEERCKYAHT